VPASLCVMQAAVILLEIAAVALYGL